MESSTAPRSHGGKSLGLRISSAPRARRRGSVLGQRLWLGDSTAAFAAGLVALLVFDRSPGIVGTIGFAVFVSLLWTLAAFSLGLYRGEQLASWASALAEVPAFAVALVLLSWPVFAVAVAFGFDHRIMITLLTVVLVAGFDTIARTAVRARIHRAEDLRQRTLILGSGVVADQLIKKLHNNDQYGLVPVGIVDDELHDVGENGLPWLGGFTDLSEVLVDEKVDRVIIAFSRASHVQLLDAIRTCRDGGVAIDVVPRLFEFLDGLARSTRSAACR